MKHFFVLFLLAIAFANFSFGLVRIKPKTAIQYSKEEHAAANLWKISEPLNREALESTHGIVYPGQWLVFAFPTRNDLYPLQTAQDDYPLKMAKKVLASNPMDYANELPILPDNAQAADHGEEKPKTAMDMMLEISDFILNNLLWILIILCVLVIIILTLTNEKFRDFMSGAIFPETEKGKFSKDPAKEGKPFVPGGVKDENSTEHFVELAVRSNPELNPSNIIIKDKKRVFISTPNGKSAIVEFADGSNETLLFRNVPGWSAMVSTNGGKKFKRELFFQDCGNPVYSRTSMNDSGLIITDEPVNFGDETSPEQIVFTKEKEEAKQEAEKPDETSTESDLYRVSDDQAKVADEFLKTQKAHKVTMRYTKNADGSFTLESIFETKNEAVGKAEKQQKTEEKN